MNPQANSDTSLAFCMHCATQLMPYARVCPCCGEDPFADNGLADGSWFDEASVNVPRDPILETMMAIAAARPKGARPGDASFQRLGAPVLVRMPSAAEPPGPTLALATAGALPRPSTRRRRVLTGVAAITVLAALTAGLLSVNGVSPGQPAEPKTGTSFAAAVSQARGTVQSDGGGEPVVASVASPESPLEAPPQQRPAARPEEDARTIATALGLGLGERREVAVPAPVPASADRIAPLAASTATAPGGSAPSTPCSDALAALALCGKP